MPRTGAQDSDNDEPISMKSMDYPRVALRPGVTRERWTKIAVEQFEAMLHIRKESCEGLNHTKPHPRCCLPPVPPCHYRRLALGSAQPAVARPSPLPPLPLLPSVATASVVAVPSSTAAAPSSTLLASRCLLNSIKDPLPQPTRAQRRRRYRSPRLSPLPPAVVAAVVNNYNAISCPKRRLSLPSSFLLC
ncbi:hypothetical protein BHE74_00050042 [Ensete ventricosum]|nr:hypothetical protein BHE74_00050042 [Ensete ventricosum]